MRTALTIAFLALLAGWSPVAADTVHLRSGARIAGKVLEQSDESVKLQVEVASGTAVISIARTRIDRIEHEPGFAERLKAAADLLKANQAPAAEDAYRALVHEEPANAAARMGLAQAMAANFKAAEALKTLEHYLELVTTDRDADLLLMLAEQYLYMRDYRSARRATRDASAARPGDRAWQSVVDELSKRIDRVRAGLEPLQDPRADEQAGRIELIRQRAEFNPELGNNREAEEAGNALVAWTAEAQPRLIVGRHMEISVPAADLSAYNQGGSAANLQGKVTKCEFKVKVDETIWLSLYDHQKALYIYGWYYQLRDRYPRCYPTVTVVAEVEERGRKTEKRLARGTFDGRRDSVTVDRWTKENRDPSRPVRQLIR